MKTLHLLRHAKSDWGDMDLSDHARPLNKRGIAAAKAMGRHLVAEGFQPDLIFCSTARRARETLERLARSLRGIPTTFHDELYLVSPQEVLAFIRRAPETAQSILLVGHNPTTHDIALSLTARAAPGRRQDLAELKEKYPTGALCTIRFAAAHWRQITPGTGTLARFLKPRDLTRTPPAKRKAVNRKAGKKKAVKRSPRR
jgi:phosphohistidine phosphatase